MTTIPIRLKSSRDIAECFDVYERLLSVAVDLNVCLSLSSYANFIENARLAENVSTMSVFLDVTKCLEDFLHVDSNCRIKGLLWNSPIYTLEMFEHIDLPFKGWDLQQPTRFQVAISKQSASTSSAARLESESDLKSILGFGCQYESGSAPKLHTAESWNQGCTTKVHAFNLSWEVAFRKISLLVENNIPVTSRCVVEVEGGVSEILKLGQLYKELVGPSTVYMPGYIDRPYAVEPHVGERAALNMSFQQAKIVAAKATSTSDILGNFVIARTFIPWAGRAASAGNHCTLRFAKNGFALTLGVEQSEVQDPSERELMEGLRDRLGNHAWRFGKSGVSSPKTSEWPS